MNTLQHLLDNNARWAEAMSVEDPAFFSALSAAQSPELLWIGCSDSRVPASQIIGLEPGRVFVHRNVANVVVHSDLNMLSVLQYAVEVLGVRHVVVCGHYGCGGVQAAMEPKEHGLIDNWLRHIKDVYLLHRGDLEAIEDREERGHRLCELNVIAQVENVCNTTIVQGAWRRGEPLAVHGWIYALRDGRLRELHPCVSDPEQLPAIYRMG